MSMEFRGLDSEPRPAGAAGPDRLESWKEVAAYLRRSERTVRRWEAREGLPVHRLRHDKRGSVYAFRSELDAWRASRQPGRDRTADGRPWLAAGVVLVGLALLLGSRALPPPTAAAATTTNAQARRAFEQGAFSSNPGRVQVESGIRSYSEAVRLDPRYASAWTGLATAHLAQSFFGERKADDTLGRARQEATRALELEPALPAARRILASVNHFLDWEHAAAERQLRRTLEVEPASSWGLSWLAELLINLRRFDEAMAYAQRAQEASPRWLEPITVAGNVHLFAGHADLAIAEYTRALRIEPGFGLANHFLGRAYLAQGEHRKAVAQLRKSDALLGQVPFSRGDLGYALAVAGQRGESERIRADLLRRRESGFYPAFPIAAIEMGLGDPDAALTWLERACDERAMGYYFPSADPIYEPVRRHPRFTAILKRMNLPPP
jgi:tetratricopeptide (TPR) repeat protein